MLRGYFSDLGSNPAYAGSKKHWSVHLQQSTCYWYELIVNPPDFLDTKGEISSQLDALRLKLENTIDKRFIYFFASRKRVRFDTTRPPRYNRWKKQLEVRLLVGRDRIRHTVLVPIDAELDSSAVPDVAVSESYIQFVYSETASATYTVHDFLQHFDISLGIPTLVHYVGITKEPAERPLSRKHRGIADTLYRVSNEDNDFFVFINLFKVYANATSDSQQLHFVVANSMIDEIPTDQEGSIIEKALIAYFDCPAQRLNRDKERAEFHNSLASLASEHNILSLAIHLEIEPRSEYFAFGSDTRPSADSHTFLYRAANGQIELRQFESELDLLAYMQAGKEP